MEADGTEQAVQRRGGEQRPALRAPSGPTGRARQSRASRRPFGVADRQTTQNKASRNERTKIVATAIDNLAVTLVVTGGIAPSASTTYLTPGPGSGYRYAGTVTRSMAGSEPHPTRRAIS
jgi:hypothetical protein